MLGMSWEQVLSRTTVNRSRLHLPIAENISVSGFTWLGNNRKFVNVRAPKPSGGIGILINQRLQGTYDINILNKQHDGILAVEFRDKYTDFSVVLITCYLSPENSVWGRNASSFFVNLLSLVYTCSFADIIIICGDFNARIGCTLDFIPDIDNVNERLVLDHSKNSHGRSFIEFLKEGKMCILNGRFEKEKDNYTFISSRGKSVVDYFVVPHECLQYCSEFSVKTVSDIVSEYKLQDELRHTKNRTRKRLKVTKPYWSDELTSLWKNMCESEKRYTKCKSDKHCKRVNFQLFKISRNKFDRALRQAQRNYKKKLVNDLENFNTRNPKDFWNHLKSLGPKKKAEIPMQVQIEEKNVFETNTILQKWQNDFCNLYNKPNNINFDRDFYINILRQKCALENSDNINYEIQNDPLNKPFCHDELKQVIKRLKTNKAVGCDNVPNEVLKQRSVSEMLLKYFHTCFESGIVPTIWLKSIINPIPKDSKKNPYVPLNYRGISL